MPSSIYCRNLNCRLILTLLLYISKTTLSQRTLINDIPCEIPFVFGGQLFTDCFQFGGREWCIAIDGRFGVCAPRSSLALSPTLTPEPPTIPIPQPSPSPTPESSTVPIPQLSPSPTPEPELSTGRDPQSSPSPTTEPELPTDPTPTSCCAALSNLRFSSDLPIMIVNTNGKRIRDEPKISGTLYICGSNQSVSEHLIGIEIRGSTSARDFLKKSYGVETRDKEGSDLDTSILGFPQGSDWVFYGPEMDKSMGIKNFLTMELYRSGGKYSSRVQYFELFLIDDKTELSMDHYNGLYILMEKIKRGDERVAIKRLKDDDISGGYIFKHDNNNFDKGDQIFNSSESGLAFIVTYPAKANVVKRSLDYLSAYVGEVELALRSRNRSIWRNYINEDSFIDIFLITELTKNPDGYRGSFYFHKDPGGILSAGPPWDFNEAYGVCCGYPIEGYFNEGVSRGRSGGSAISPNGWRYNICVDRGRCIVDPMDGVSWWFRTLLEDNTFRSKLRRRWQLLRRGPWSISTIQSYFSRIRTAISEPVRRNANRWNRELAIKNESASFDEWNDEISRMESWTISRLEWIDARLGPTRQRQRNGL